MQAHVHAGAHAEDGLREDVGAGQARAAQRRDDVGQPWRAHRGTRVRLARRCSDGML